MANKYSKETPFLVNGLCPLTENMSIDWVSEELAYNMANNGYLRHGMIFWYPDNLTDEREEIKSVDWPGWSWNNFEIEATLKRCLNGDDEEYFLTIVKLSHKGNVLANVDTCYDKGEEFFKNEAPYIRFHIESLLGIRPKKAIQLALQIAYTELLKVWALKKPVPMEKEIQVFYARANDLDLG